MAGILSVYYADIANVEHCVPYSDGVVVSLKSGHGWSLIETDGASASSVSEEGHAYRQTAELTYHGQQGEVQRTLDEMTRCRFLLKVIDTVGTEWLMGSMDCPLRFSFESNNDGEPGGTTAYTLRFTALCPTPALRIY